MAFNLRLPALLAKMRWKFKIRDKERVEEPHITIICKTEVWRVSLRDGRFLNGGSWKDMPDRLQQAVEEHWQQLCELGTGCIRTIPYTERKATMAATKPKKLFLLGPGAKMLLRYGLPASQVQGRRSLVQALSEASPSVLWLAASAGAPDELLQEALQLPPRRRGRLGGLLTLYRPRTESIQPLDDLFEPFVWSTENFHFLPLPELAEALADERRGDLFIGGYADPHNQTLTLVRGDLRRLSVPVSSFRPSRAGEKADAFRLAFTDSGNTIRLGDYEAATDAILYEADPDYRRRLLAKRRAEDKTFGACLRRLRLQRGLRRADFGDVAAKTIARIERGETDTPHGQTLRALAARLQVDPDEILSY